MLCCHTGAAKENSSSSRGGPKTNKCTAPTCTCRVQEQARALAHNANRQVKSEAMKVDVTGLERAEKIDGR